VDPLTSRRLHWPASVRLTSDGQHVAVADTMLSRVQLFRVDDGACVGHAGVALSGLGDLEECGGGGWLAACGVPQHSVELVQVAAEAASGRPEREGEPVELLVYNVAAMALVHGLGLVARHRGVRRLEDPRIEVCMLMCVVCLRRRTCQLCAVGNTWVGVVGLCVLFVFVGRVSLPHGVGGVGEYQRRV
jgi:hypothetical protein